MCQFQTWGEEMVSILATVVLVIILWNIFYDIFLS